MAIKDILQRAEDIAEREDNLLLASYILDMEQAQSTADKCGCAQCILLAGAARKRYEEQFDYVNEMEWRKREGGSHR